MSNLTFIQYENLNENLKSQLKELFISAFPKQERPPFAMIENLSKIKSNDFYAVLNDTEFAGLVFINTFEDILGIQYLAIDESKRDQGIGSKILDKLKVEYPNFKINIAMEKLDAKALNNDQRIARKKFYLKNEFKSYQVFVNEFDVVYELLSFGGEVNFQDYLKLSNNFWDRDVSEIVKKYE